MQLVAKTSFNYAGRDLKPGDTFEASQSDAFILTRVGKADEVAAEVEARAAASERQQSQPHLQSQPTERGGRRGNRYRRTDMQADD